MTAAITSNPVAIDPKLGPTVGPDAVLDALDRPDFRALRAALDHFHTLGETASGYPVARPSDCTAIMDRLEEIFRTHQRRFERRDTEIIARFLELLQEFEASSALRAYGAEALRVLFLKVRALVILGRAQEALDLVEPWAERPYRIEGSFAQIQEAFELDLMSRLSLGRFDEVQRVAFSRARFLCSLAVSRAPFIFNLFFRALSIAPSRHEPQRWAKALLSISAQVCIRKERIVLRNRWVRALWRGAKLAALATGSAVLVLDLISNAYRTPLQLTSEPARKARPPKARCGDVDTPSILVTRPMGGLGDIMMMTPGLRALRQKHGRKIAFAIPKKFHPAFENNPDLELLDSDGFINLDQYRAWINLGHCPAARYEAGATPIVKKGRVELFARGMGVSKSHLIRCGVKPVCMLSPTQMQTRDALKDLASGAGRKLVGVGMFSRETYRDYPHLKTLIATLAERHFVVAIHERPSPLPASPFVIGWFNRPLADAIAAVSACDAFVSVDSSLYHFAAAFDLPAVALFGPTSGKIRSSHMSNVVLVEAEHLPCRPCWRNEDEKCSLVNTFESACMRAIQVARVVAGVDSQLATKRQTVASG